MEKKIGNFITDEYGNILFYHGDIHELDALDFSPELIQENNLLSLFDYKVVETINQSGGLGEFIFRQNNFEFQRRAFRAVSGETQIFLELVADNGEDVSFYSMLIHEIKNPLAAVRNLIQALANHIQDLKAKPDPDEFELAEDYFTRITGEIDRLNRLLTSVKFISKHMRPLYINFDLIKVAKDTIAIFEGNLQSEKVNLEVDFPEVLYFYGDSDQLQQVFNNLLSNALEATIKEGGKIFFKISKTGKSQIQIVIEDQGKGIPKPDLDKIFKAFYTRKIGGMGVGLTVVRRIVNQYKGKLDIQSTFQKGTKISILLPMGEQQKLSKN